MLLAPISFFTFERSCAVLSLTAIVVTINIVMYIVIVIFISSYFLQIAYIYCILKLKLIPHHTSPST